MSLSISDQKVGKNTLIILLKKSDSFHRKFDHKIKIIMN